MTVFTIKDVRKSFMNGEVEEEVLKGVNLSLQEGEITALVGASGSGKSTLLTIAAGLQPASAGQILFEGEDIVTLNQEQIRNIRANAFGFVFQSSHLVPFLSVEEQLLLMLDVAETKLNKQEKQNEIEKILKTVELEHRKDVYPASLSGGEKQRVAIARAIIHQPRILFADEPTANLDSKRSEDVMKLIRTLTKTRGVATLIVTHDEEMLAYVDHVIHIKDGLIS
ncbi:ABC transporter ATP-binding protein [Paraliobacillus sediminis]|uniref:ABC transporter ATP-binding protein n=1 Tax=Paraliobacillus sediminis TaxID=1885916 RepID=UPI000E3D04D8|nr:ABC transporter ATP-binding protein [Paraliobacillus sediminis]